MKAPTQSSYPASVRLDQRDGAAAASFAAARAEPPILDPLRAHALLRSEQLLKVTAAIADAVTEEEVFAALVDHVAAALGASSAGLWLVIDGGSAQLARSCGYSAAALQAISLLQLDSRPLVPITEAMSLGEPVWIPSQVDLLERYPHLRSAVTPRLSYRVCCLPLRNRDAVIGGLGLTLEEGPPGDASERDFLLLVARYAGQALERLRLLAEARRSRDEATAAAQRLVVLGQASRAFAEAHLDLRTRLQAVASTVGEVLDSAVSIGLIEADGAVRISACHHPDPEAHQQLSKQFAASPLPRGEGVTGAIALSGESVLLPSLDSAVAAGAAPQYRAFLERFPAYALMGAALKVQGRVIGTVTASRVRAGQPYAIEDLRLLEELAERAAIAIENARLYHETLDAGVRAQQLYSFAHSVVEADNVEAVFEAAIAAIQAATGATSSAVLTFDERGIMRFRAFHGLSEAYRRAVEGHSPWPADASAPQPVLVPDVTLDAGLSSYRGVLAAERIAALAFIPLLNSGRLLGKFMLYYDRPGAFDAQEIELAQAIGSHLASVVVRFRVTARLRETLRANELFAGVLAHDLRNPLGAIMSAAHLIMAQREGGATEGDREYKPLNRILTSGRRMANMIEQLLDFTRVRSHGGIDIAPHQVDLAVLCKDAVDELELAHPEWKLVQEFQGDTRGSWDAQRLLQVLSNLLGNAGQHGSAGGVIRVRIDGSAPERVSVEVHNAGSIPASRLPHLFDPLARGAAHPTRARGLGLGLFIVREIVQAHGGTIQVSSDEQRGTAVSLELPRSASPSIARLSVSSP